MSATPTLNGQVIGQAHYATRALLERELDTLGSSFLQSVVLGATADSGALEPGQSISRIAGTLRVDAAVVREAVAELTGLALLEALPGDASRLRLTDDGRSLLRRIRAAIGEITARLYGDVPADDLATAGKVLTLVTSRANAELADGPERHA